MTPDAGTNTGTHAKEAGTFAGLLADIFVYTGRLIRGEMELAKAEFVENLRAAALGIGLIVGSVLLLLVALNLLAASLVLAIVGTSLSPGAAALVVGACTVALAALLGGMGAASLRPGRLLPRRTMHNIRRDAQSLKEGMSHDSQIIR